MTRDEVLRLLQRDGAYHSGQSIAEALGISRAAVWKAVESLRADGYAIDSMTRQGYRLLAAPRRLLQAEVLQQLGAHPWAEYVQVLDVVDSTNNRAKQLAAAGAPEGTVVVADRQTGGRGRLGRSFDSPANQGVSVSVILRPQALPQQLMHLTAAVAVAACDAVERACGLRPGVKWVNDLVAGKKKLAGILTELSVELETGMTQYAVVGIGINCCQSREQLPETLQDIATSVYLQTGVQPDRNRLTAELIRSLYELSRTLLSGQDAWMERYRQLCVTIGQPVQVLRAGQIRPAFATGVDREAALEVRYEDGSCARVTSGEVSVRGLYGYV